MTNKTLARAITGVGLCMGKWAGAQYVVRLSSIPTVNHIGDIRGENSVVVGKAKPLAVGDTQ